MLIDILYQSCLIILVNHLKNIKYRKKSTLQLNEE